MCKVQPQAQRDFCDQQQDQQVREALKHEVIFSDCTITTSKAEQTNYRSYSYKDKRGWGETSLCNVLVIAI